MNKDIPVGKKMTDREKIAQIIAEHLCPQGKSHKRLYGSERMCYSRDNFAECEKVSKCVDALIAAGIGDISKWQLMSKVLHNQIIENSREEKHRTEVAERQAIFLSKMLADKTRKDYPWQAWFDAAQKQAKKELTEE